MRKTRIKLITGEVRDVEPAQAKWAVKKGLAKVVEENIFDLSGTSSLNFEEVMAEATAA